MAQPTYSVDDTVYLDSSARRGFLEQYKITGIIATQQSIQYTIDLAPLPPTPRTIADRYNVRLHSKQLYFSESELITFCEAIPLIISYLTTQLSRYQQLSDAHCGTGSGSE
jgi:hypothetical protein